MNRRVSYLLPQVSFMIMFALAVKPRHGYELLEQIAADSDETIQVSSGALYTAIQHLSQDNLIEEMPFEGDQRRRYYRLTKKGYDRLSKDVAYFAHITELAKQRHMSPDTAQGYDY